MARDYESPVRDFHSLSLRDLLDARDQYHLHLMYKRNVVATAVGLYRIRRQEVTRTREAGSPIIREEAKLAPRERPIKPPRRLYDSVVQPYSWPCVLVFVKGWARADEFGGGREFSADDMVPSRLYLADGRVVPVCVVEAPKAEVAPAPPREEELYFPDSVIGGGYPIRVKVQEQQKVASLGCLVTDGHATYALTNRHVTGPAGQEVCTLLRGREVRIGTSSGKQLGRVPFTELYPGYSGHDVCVNMDVGLVEIEDLNRWTAQVYGIGVLGRPLDLSADNLSLRLIGCPVRAYGCAGHEQQGEIQALFYRYRAMGGVEYVADFLIGPRLSEEGALRPLTTRPGDSGTLWCLECEEAEEKSDEGREGPRPVAIQWGGQSFLQDRGREQYPMALATCLSTVCRRLEVDVVRDWRLDFPEYWGQTGHPLLLQIAVDRLEGEAGCAPLHGLLAGNLSALRSLATVPDAPWKKLTGRAGRENPCHYADIDLDGFPKGLCLAAWGDFYEGENTDKRHRGILPFRVWQTFSEMVKMAEAGDLAAFLCAAGILSHYAGDACMVMHTTRFSQGDPNTKGDENLHHDFEEEMVSRHQDDLAAQVPALAGALPMPPDIGSGQTAGEETLALMQAVQKRSDPETVAKVYRAARGRRASTLWEQYGGNIAQDLAEGCAFLIRLWKSAWEHKQWTDAAACHFRLPRGGESYYIYDDPTFLRSCYLEEIAPHLG